MPGYYDFSYAANAVNAASKAPSAPASPVSLDADGLLKNYGVYTHPYGTVWPELTAALTKLYRNRLASVPWLPRNWISVIMGSVHGANGNIAIIAPSTANYNGGRGADFLDTPEKKQWWDELAASSSKTLMAFAANKAAEGQAELEEAYDDAAFWDSAYKIQNLLRSPLHTVMYAADTYTKYQWLFNPAIIVGAGLVGLYLFTRKK